MATSQVPAHVPKTIIVMGVSGCGKTLIGTMLAEKLGGLCEDADDFHSEANKDKMRAGTPLADDDRWPWYAALRARIEERKACDGPYILACSALKAIYREKLQNGDLPQDFLFVHLKGRKEVIFERMSKRKDHYMPVSLLDSQFAILEESPDLLTVSLEQTPEEILAEILQQLEIR